MSESKPCGSNASSLTVKIRFDFEGPVDKRTLHKAIARALATKQFRLIGMYTILETIDELDLEPEEHRDAPSPRQETGQSHGVTPAPSSVVCGPTSAFRS